MTEFPKEQENKFFVFLSAIFSTGFPIKQLDYQLKITSSTQL